MLESKEATAVTADLLMPLRCPKPEWKTIWGKSTASKTGGGHFGNRIIWR